MSQTSAIYGSLPSLLRLCVLMAISYTEVEEFADRARSRLRSQADSFDFIVVGSGSSGSVLASRLSEHFSVLLLEAGGTSNPFVVIPALTLPLYWETKEDWKYQTVPQTHAAFGLNNHTVNWSAGKVLGGSSGINGLIYIRGNVQGFDRIAQETGDSVWAMENVLKYYKKIEDYAGYFDEREHGKGGPVPVQKGYLSPFTHNLMRAGEEMGYQVRDPNPDGPLQEGFSPQELFISDGLRWSAYHGYIKPILKRKLLTIRMYSYVHKVILDENNRATGVEYLQHGKTRTAHARKEVILSAGGIQSPKILMLSGIGPKDDLEKLDIPVKLDLPVGQSLQDKYGALIGPFTVNPGSSFVLSRDVTLRGVMEFLTTRKGPYTTSHDDAGYTISSTMDLNNEVRSPDIHAYVFSTPMDPISEWSMSGSLNFKPEISKKYFSRAYGNDSVTKLVCVSKPFGFGTLKLRDADPMSPPLIDPKYLQDRRDMDVLIEGLKFAAKIMEATKSMQDINSKLIPVPVPGCEDVEYRSNAYWECYGRTMTGTAFKYCSTAPIGKDTSDPIAVVDSRLRVLGAKGLRVVDGSVLRERYVSTNHPTCTMLGELAADFILKEYLSENS